MLVNLRHKFFLRLVLAIALSLCGTVLAIGGTIEYNVIDIGVGQADPEAGGFLGINASGVVTGVAGVYDPSTFTRSTYAFLYQGNGPLQVLDGILPTGINDAGQIVGYTNAGGLTSVIRQPDGSMQAFTSGIQASAISDTGQIVGDYSLADNGQSFYCGGSATNVAVDIGIGTPCTPPDPYGGASAVNSAGQIAGTLLEGSTFPSTVQHAFLFSGGSFLDLGTLGGTDSNATAINASGEVVGWANTPGGSWSAFLYNGTGPMQDLGNLPGGDLSWAYAINDSGQVVGSSDNSTDGQETAFIYQSGSMQNLNDDIDPNLGIDLTSASGINDSGQIVGTGLLNGQYDVFLLDPVSSSSAAPEPGGLFLSIAGMFAVFLRQRSKSDTSPGASPVRPARQTRL